ncbi:MAG: Rrf2 family transcriptional regulator [Deltaproteobacteria bacterium]|nr:MAG: Rrf2 family transcriptional regulator [Deltaproteobacteria bacterium]TNF26204.1 MAG: Rrf2 family transcriptional regulator [Deltaproteobacteria bacterium]
MRLATFTDYSLRVLIFLALKEDELSTVAEIADKYQISKNHLVKVVHKLSTLKIIDSFKGKGGGISLAISPEDINVGKIVRELEKDSLLLECFGSSSECKINPVCKMKAALRQAENNFYNTLEEYSLADLTTNQRQLSSILFS